MARPELTCVQVFFLQSVLRVPSHASSTRGSGTPPRSLLSLPDTAFRPSNLMFKNVFDGHTHARSGTKMQSETTDTGRSDA